MRRFAFSLVQRIILLPWMALDIRTLLQVVEGQAALEQMLMAAIETSFGLSKTVPLATVLRGKISGIDRTHG